MFGVDDLLLLPAKGLGYICNEIANAAEQQLSSDTDAVRTELRELYMQLEAGRITDEEFDAREAELLDRLDQLEEAESSPTQGGQN